MKKARHGIYSGPDGRLLNKGTLLMPDPDAPDNFLCQFDALHLTESHGWHSIPKKFLTNLEYEEEQA